MRVAEQMENDENLVSIKTEKVSGKLTIHIPLTLMFWQSMDKSAKMDLFSQSKWNRLAKIMLNQWRNPCDVCA